MLYKLRMIRIDGSRIAPVSMPCQLHMASPGTDLAYEFGAGETTVGRRPRVSYGTELRLFGLVGMAERASRF